MSESVQLTAEVFIDTGKDFRPEDSLTVPYICALGETVTLDFDLTGFEHTCGFRFDPLLEDGSMVKLEGIALTYEDDETKQILLIRQSRQPAAPEQEQDHNIGGTDHA